jgi:biotin carboxyl carrier protein
MRREYSATLGPREIDVVVEVADGHLWEVVVDGRRHSIDAREVRPGTWSLLIDGRSRVVDLDTRPGGTALLTDRTETVALLEDARRKRLARAVGAAGGAGGGEVIKAPIAGKVVKLLVAAGDAVEAGQGVAVLEAMKMENEIKADRGGVVKQIHAEPGASVETQQKLVTLDSADTGGPAE